MAERVVLDLKSNSSIRNLKEALKAKARAIEEQTTKDVRYFTEQGEQMAKDYLHMFLGRPSSMERTIGHEFDASTNRGRIFVTHIGAPYVEFGTGVIGEAHPHPTGPAPGGFRQTPWVYPSKTGELDVYGNEVIDFITTYGQRSKPFMYSTRRQLMDSIDRLMRKRKR